MEHTPSVEEMIAVVQAYIKERKGRSVRIVLNNPMSIRKHMVMLNDAPVLLRRVYDACYDCLSPQSIPAAVLVIAKYQYQMVS